MLKITRYFVPPPDETVLWRFMDLEKLISLLCERSLYMCRIDKFLDPWEGRLPPSVYDDVEDKLADERTLDDEDAAKMLELLDTSARRNYYANCWHASEHESAALWGAYGNRARVAIRSTVGRVKEAILPDRDFHIGKVEYRDFGRAEKILMTTNFLLLKRISFRHEEEVRVLTESDPEAPAAAESDALPVDPTKLISAIYLAPDAPNWLRGTLESLLGQLSFGAIRVVHSDLYDKRIR